MRLLIALLLLRAVASPFAVSRDLASGRARFVARVRALPATEDRARRFAVESPREAGPPSMGFELPGSGRLVPPLSPDAAADGRRFAFHIPLRC